MTHNPRLYALPLSLSTAALCVVLCACAQGTASGSRGAGRPAQVAGQETDHVPLRSGRWEQQIADGGQVVYGPLPREEGCPGSMPLSPFPSMFPAQHFGKTLPQKLLIPDVVLRLPDGRYLVKGGTGTSLGGDIVYEHLITLEPGDRYQDVLTVTSHAAAAHPAKHVSTGSGRWVGPCAEPPG